MKNEISITRKKFHDTINKVMKKSSPQPIVELTLTIFFKLIENELFGEPDEVDTDKTESEAPFKVDDKVFVISNKGDGNEFVNQVVTVKRVHPEDCLVGNGEITQLVNFDNLRKVETP